MSKTKKVSPTQERAFAQFVEAQGERPFRRQDLVTKLYPHINPRSMKAADDLSDILIRRLHGAGRLVKAGHVHWQLVTSQSRTLLSGRQVNDAPDVVELKLQTRCPGKYVVVDLETGESWEDASGTWKCASAVATKEASDVLSKSGVSEKLKPAAKEDK